MIAIGHEKEEQFQAFIISLIGKFEVKSVKLKRTIKIPIKD